MDIPSKIHETRRTKSGPSPRNPPRKRKYISHDSAIDLIKCEKDSQHALKIFNMVSEQNGFQHGVKRHLCNYS
ncbi:hypothetical protein glysoja_017724 [Glycine soja]|nr:hypothetical protein glysoja_017724 [Glycine soja]